MRRKISKKEIPTLLGFEPINYNYFLFDKDLSVYLTDRWRQSGLSFKLVEKIVGKYLFVDMSEKTMHRIIVLDNQIHYCYVYTNINIREYEVIEIGD